MYDAMFGSGQEVVKELIPNIATFRCEINPTFNGISPEPIRRNLDDLVNYLKTKEKKPDLILITDGDADRIGLMDGDGNYIDSHHIMLLLINYLVNYKKQKGKVITGFSSVTKINKLCEYFGLPLQVVPIGFKHASEIMQNESVMLAGEESGGIAIGDHIPERDGIWMGLMIFEFMAETKKSINELIDEVYQITGAFNFQRRDLKIDETLKKDIVKKCAGNEFKQFGNAKIISVDDLDGYKFFLSDESWVMIRPSGTEPVLRVYAEAPNEALALGIIADTQNEILA